MKQFIITYMIGSATLWFIINLNTYRARGPISDYRQFFDIHILQGSVATYLRYGGTVK